MTNTIAGGQREAKQINRTAPRDWAAIVCPAPTVGVAALRNARHFGNVCYFAAAKHQTRIPSGRKGERMFGYHFFAIQMNVIAFPSHRIFIQKAGSHFVLFNISPSMLCHSECSCICSKPVVHFTAIQYSNAFYLPHRMDVHIPVFLLWW